MWHSKLYLHPRSPPLLAVLTRMRNEYKRVQIAAVGAPYSVKESHYGEQKRQERYNYHRNKQEHHNQQQLQQKQRQEQQRKQSRNANKITSTKEANELHNTNGSDVSCSTSSHNLISSPISSSSSSSSRYSHTRYGESNRSNTNSASMIIEDKILEILSNEKSKLSQISDTSINSPTFYIEVSKLLGLGASFHASTTTPLIAQAISYICQHIKQMTTVRQIMSACIPIINLQDGQTAGRNIVREHFLQPLINAVIESIPCECLDNATVISSSDATNCNLESNTMRGGDNSTTTKQQNGMTYESTNETVGRGKVRSEVNLFEHMYEEEQLTWEQYHCQRLHQEHGQMQFAIFSTFSLICKMLDVEDTPHSTIEVYNTYATTTMCNTEIKHNDSEVQRERFVIDAEYIMTLAELYEASCQHIIYLLKQRIATKNNDNEAGSTASLPKATFANLAEFDQYFFEKNEMRVVIQAFLAIEKAARLLEEPRGSNKIELSSKSSFLQSHNNNFNNTRTITNNNNYSDCTETNRQERNVEVVEVVKELYLSFSEMLTLFMELLRPSLTQHNRLRTSHLLYLISLLSLVEKKEEAVNSLLQMILELIKLSVSHASKRDVIGIINTVTNIITRTQIITHTSRHSTKLNNDATATANVANETRLSITPYAHNNSTNAAVVNSSFLNSLLSALRPQFFLLTSQQNNHLLTFQCDMLINKLVRWNKIEGVRVPDDLLCLLLSQLREQVHKATEQELLRYLRTLTKLHSSSGYNRSSSSINTNGNNTESRWELASANIVEEKMHTSRVEHMRRHDNTRHEKNLSENKTSSLYQHSNTNISRLHGKSSTSHDDKFTNDIHKCQKARNDSNYHTNAEGKVSHTQQDAKYYAIQSVINDCALRAMSLAKENAISAANAARLIILLHHLSYNNLDDVFNSALSLFEKSIQGNAFEQTKDNNNKINIKCNRSGHDNNANKLDDAATLQNTAFTSNNIKVEEGKEVQIKNVSNSITVTGSVITQNNSYNAEVNTSESKSNGDAANDESHRKENEADDDDNEDDENEEEEEEEEEVEDDEQEGENEIVANIDVDEESANLSENKHLSYLLLLDAINLVMSSWDVNVFSSDYYHERVNTLRHNVMDRVESSLLQANTADELLNFYNKVRHSQKLLASSRVSDNVNTNYYTNNSNYCNDEYANTNGWNHSYNAMHSNIHVKQMNADNENNITGEENKEENVENSDWRCSQGNYTNRKGIGSMEENASDDKGDEANENGLKPEEAGLGAFTMETFARRVEMMVPHCNAHQLCKLAFDVAACCQNGSVSVNRAHSVLERVFQHININMKINNVNGEQMENAFVLTATDAKFLIDAVRFSSSYHLAIPSVVYTTINNEFKKMCEVLNTEEINLINGDKQVENKLAIIDQVLNTVKSLTNYFKNIANIVSNKDKGNKELTLDSINDDSYSDESESYNNNVNNGSDACNNNNSNSTNKNKSKSDSEDSRGKCSKQVIEDTRDSWHKIFSDDVRSAVCALELSLFKLLPIMLETRIDLPPAEFVSESVVLVERATSLESVTNNLMQVKSIMVNGKNVREHEEREELEQKMQLRELQEFESEEHGEDAEHEDEQENDEIRESSDYDADKLQQEELEEEEEEEEEILEEFEAERDTNLKTSSATSTRQVILTSAFSTHSLQIRLSLQEALFSVADLVSAVMFELRIRLADHKPLCIRSTEENSPKELEKEEDVHKFRCEESNATKRNVDHTKMQSMNNIDKVIKTGNSSILMEEKESKNLAQPNHSSRGEISSGDADSYKNNDIKENSIYDNVTFQVDDLLTLLHCYVYAEVRHSELLKEIMTEILLSASTMTLINLTEFLLYIMRNGITYSSSSHLLRRAVEAKIVNARIDECCYALYKIQLNEKEKMISPDNTPTTTAENRSSDDDEATVHSVSMITTPMLVEMLIDRLNSFVNTETKWMTLANSDYTLSELIVVVNTINNFGAQAKHVHDAYYTIAVRACVVEMQDLFNAVSEHPTCKKQNKLIGCTKTDYTKQRLENFKISNSDYKLESIEEYWPIYLTRLLESIFRLLFRLPFLRNKEHARVSAYTLHKLVLMAADIVEICFSTFARPQWRSLWSLTNSRMLEHAFKAHAHFMTLYNVNFLQTIFEKKYALPWMLTSAIIRNNRALPMQISVTNWTTILKHISASLLFYERSEMEDSCAWMQLVQRWCATAVEYFTAVCRPYTTPQSLPNTHLTITVITEVMNGLIIVYEMLCGVNTIVSENCLHILRQLIICTAYRSNDRETNYNNKQHYSQLDNTAHYTNSDRAGGGGGGNKKELYKLSTLMLHSCVLLLQAHQNETTVLSNKEQEHCFELIEKILEEIGTRKYLLFGDKMELLHATLTNYMSSDKTKTYTRLTGVSNDLEQENKKSQESVVPTNSSLRRVMSEKNDVERNRKVDAATNYNSSNEENANHEGSYDNINSKVVFNERLELLLTKVRSFIAKEMMMSLTKDYTVIDVGEMFTRRLLLSLNCCLVRYVVRASVCHEQNEKDENKDDNGDNNVSTISNAKSAVLTNIVQRTSNLTDISEGNNDVDSDKIFTISKNVSSTKDNKIVNSSIDDDDDNDDVISIADKESKAKSREEALHACVDVLVNALLALMRYKRASMQQRGAVCELSVHTRVARKILNACDDELKAAGHGKNETVAQIYHLCKMLCAAEN